MCLLWLLMLIHASYELQDTGGQKQVVGRYREEGKKWRRRYREKKKIFPSAKTVQCLLFYALAVPSPHVCAINLPSSAAWKSQRTPPPTPWLANIKYIHTTALSHIIIFTVFFLCCSVCIDTFNPFISTAFLILQSLDHIPTHASILSCLSICSSPHTGNWCKYLGGPPVSSTAAVSCGLK